MMDIFSKRFSQDEMASLLQKHTHDLSKGLKPLYDRIGDARIVMLGEASHGTHEYYLWRTTITQYLVQEKGFNIIGVEGDWPDCYQINRFIRHWENSGKTAHDVLKKFYRWPTWMWSNWEISALVEWLRDFNQGKNYENQVGFYGLDVYSLWESLDAIMDYLQENDPDALETAKRAINCFEPYKREGLNYATGVRFVPETCEREVLELLKELHARTYWKETDHEAPFNARQNALTAVNAEKYFRAMVKGGPDSWNIRDTHMTDTLENLLDHHGSEAKAVVWEHNTHIGDASVTDMRQDEMVNIGQLARERWGRKDTVLVGFGSYKGSVVASEAWGDKIRVMQLPEARQDSWENLLHQFKPSNKLIISNDIRNMTYFQQMINHRAVGVVYHPARDHFGNYVPSLIPQRYDAFIFLDQTKALHPMKKDKESDKVPETYPWGV